MTGRGKATADGDASLDYVFEPVSSPTAIQQTLNRLETAIKLGLLVPGSRLPAERELCLRLGISRSTLRQALTTLTRSGHLHAVRGRGGGTFVVENPPTAPPPADRLLDSWRDICDRRLAVELGVAVLAAQRATAADLPPLRRLLDEMAEAPEDVTILGALDRRFHILLAELTGSRALISMTVRVQGSLSDLLSIMTEFKVPRSVAQDQHQTIVDAIENSDEELALSVMAGHLRNTEAALEAELPEPARFERAS